ncbi:hypothetical protein L208DRAFT_1401262, partial [Tricholoma matsutake]
MTPRHAMAPHFTTLPMQSLSRFSETAVTKRMKHLRLSRRRLRCKASWAISSHIWVSINSPAKHE